jgi:hypothetical protein
MLHMTKLLEQAIEQIRELPAEQQDAAADALFAYISNDDHDYALRPDQVAEVDRIRERLNTGKTRLATPNEVAAVRKQSNL